MADLPKEAVVSVLVAVLMIPVIVSFRRRVRRARDRGESGGWFWGSDADGSDGGDGGDGGGD